MLESHFCLLMMLMNFIYCVYVLFFRRFAFYREVLDSTLSSFGRIYFRVQVIKTAPRIPLVAHTKRPFSWHPLSSFSPSLPSSPHPSLAFSPLHFVRTFFSVCAPCAHIIFTVHVFRVRFVSMASFLIKHTLAQFANDCDEDNYRILLRA